MMVVVKYKSKRFLRLKYQPAVILEDTVDGEMTSHTALYGQCMCGDVFEMYIDVFWARCCQWHGSLASTFCSPTQIAINVGTCNDLKWKRPSFSAGERFCVALNTKYFPVFQIPVIWGIWQAWPALSIGRAGDCLGPQALMMYKSCINWPLWLFFVVHGHIYLSISQSSLYWNAIKCFALHYRALNIKVRIEMSTYVNTYYWEIAYRVTFICI